MSAMQPAEAREHIEMVDSILARTERSLGVGGEFFLVWGVVGGLIILLFQFFGVAATGALIVHNAQQMSLGRPPGAAALWAVPALIAFGVVFSIIRGRQLKRERCSLLQREFLNVLWITTGMAFLVNAGVFWIFSGVANGAIWNVCCSIVLFYIATHGNRVALAAAIVLVASLIAANFAHAYTSYILAAGLIFGYAGFGLASLLLHD